MKAMRCGSMMRSGSSRMHGLPALLFAAVKGPLDELWRLHSERDVFARLGDAELSDVVSVLKTLSDAATKALVSKTI